MRKPATAACWRQTRDRPKLQSFMPWRIETNQIYVHLYHDVFIRDMPHACVTCFIRKAHHSICSFQNNDLFSCWSSQSFHLHSGGGACFTTHAKTSRESFPRESFHMFTVNGPRTGSKTGSKLADNTIEWVLLTIFDGNALLRSANRAGSAGFAESYW